MNRGKSVRAIAAEVSTLEAATENVTSFGEYDGIRTSLGALQAKCDALIDDRQATLIEHEMGYAN